jgi:hypothetical protein
MVYTRADGVYMVYRVYTWCIRVLGGAFVGVLSPVTWCIMVYNGLLVGTPCSALWCMMVFIGVSGRNTKCEVKLSLRTSHFATLRKWCMDRDTPPEHQNRGVRSLCLAQLRSLFCPKGAHTCKGAHTVAFKGQVPVAALTV